jgi:hypothetical protein
VPATRDLLDGLAAAVDVPVEEYVADTGTAETEVSDVWETIVDAFSSYWQPVLADEPGAAGQLREEYVFPHGLGWLGLARAAGKLIAEYGKDGWTLAFRKAVGVFRLASRGVPVGRQRRHP